MEPHEYWKRCLCDGCGMALSLHTNPWNLHSYKKKKEIPSMWCKVIFIFREISTIIHFYGSFRIFNKKKAVWHKESSANSYRRSIESGRWQGPEVASPPPLRSDAPSPSGCSWLIYTDSTATEHDYILPSFKKKKKSLWFQISLLRKYQITHKSFILGFTSFKQQQIHK